MKADAIFELVCVIVNEMGRQKAGRLRVKIGRDTLLLEYRIEESSLSLVSSRHPEEPSSEEVSPPSPAPISSRRQRARKAPL